jgi:nucleoside-diphosphate-sugar epimerase
MPRVLVTGAVGQVGSELVTALRERYGGANVVAAGHKTPPTVILRSSGPFELIDVTNRRTVAAVLDKYEIDRIYHLAGILSAAGEKTPGNCYEVNVEGFKAILELARERGVSRIFYPSSIAAFGRTTPRDRTPQDTILFPNTMYGITKLTGELLGDYYFHRYGLDVRGVRYPGIISSETLPGGGTTDYAVEIFYAAVAAKRYTCYLREGTILPMMYMPDAIKAAISLMEADPRRLEHHSNFNLSAMSFSAGELATEIKKHVPGFEVAYAPDFRQAIADSWPRSIDDSCARREWDWEPEYDLAAMTRDMLDKLTRRFREGGLQSPNILPETP